jgi:hypothetical protein
MAHEAGCEIAASNLSIGRPPAQSMEQRLTNSANRKSVESKGLTGKENKNLKIGVDSRALLIECGVLGKMTSDHTTDNRAT